MGTTGWWFLLKEMRDPAGKKNQGRSDGGQERKDSFGVLGTGLGGLRKAGSSSGDGSELTLARRRGGSGHHGAAILFLLAAAVTNSLQIQGDAKNPYSLFSRTGGRTGTG